MWVVRWSWEGRRRCSRATSPSPSPSGRRRRRAARRSRARRQASPGKHEDDTRVSPSRVESSKSVEVDARRPLQFRKSQTRSHCRPSPAGSKGPAAARATKRGRGWRLQRGNFRVRRAGEGVVEEGERTMQPEDRIARRRKDVAHFCKTFDRDQSVRDTLDRACKTG